MKIKGEDFVKNIQLKKEQEELRKKMERLQEKEVNPYTDIKDEESVTKRESTYDEFEEEHYSAPEQQELGNILLSNNKMDNKKRYIILGLALVVVFLVAIIIIRLFNNMSSEEKNVEDAAQTHEEIKQDKLENRDIEQEYQKLIQNKIKKIKEEAEAKDVTPAPTKDELNEEEEYIPLQDIQELEKKEKKIEVPEPKEEVIQKVVPKKDPLDIIEKPKEVVKEVVKPIQKEVKQEVKRVEQKVEEKIQKTTTSAKNMFESVKEEPKETPKATTTQNSWPQKKSVVEEPTVFDFTKPATANTKATSGSYYVQIGSFSKKPNSDYLNNITRHGYNYTFSEVTVNGRTYIRVLVGPYTSRTSASNEVNNIKSALNIKSAFVKKL